LGWYINDELTYKDIPLAKLHYDWISRLDPNHPIWAVVTKIKSKKRALLFNGTYDIIGGDSYPVRNKNSDLGSVSKETKSAINQISNSSPVCTVIQAFNQKNYGKKIGHTPSPIELRNMIWQAINNGSNGIFLYSMYDMMGRKKGNWVGNSDRPF